MPHICHAKLDCSFKKTAKLMNSENTDIMYLKFSNALDQVPYKISFAWSIQIGLDVSTATHLNKREKVKTLGQSGNKMQCFKYIQLWNSSYTQENLSNICHKISMGSTLMNLTILWYWIDPQIEREKGVNLWMEYENEVSKTVVKCS